MTEVRCVVCNKRVPQKRLGDGRAISVQPHFHWTGPPEARVFGEARVKYVDEARREAS